jgi:hypothetical protein
VLVPGRGITLDDLTVMFRHQTGRKPTEEEAGGGGDAGGEAEGAG